MRNCHKKLFDEQIIKYQRISRTLLMINIPSRQFNQIQNLYSSDFLKEFEKVKNIASMPLNDAKLLLESEYGLFLQGHTGCVYSIAITSDNKYIVSGGADKTVRIWNLHNKVQESVLRAHSDSVFAIAITSDNNYIVSGGDRTVKIWNFKNKTQGFVLQGHTDDVFSIAITCDNQYIVSGGYDQTVRFGTINIKRKKLFCEATWAMLLQ